MAKNDPKFYTVIGKGHFPLDMLRYDCAWPADDSAINGISSLPEHFEDKNQFFDTERKIRLGSCRPPTVARWASFGWRVEEDNRPKPRLVKVKG